jgi:hypothetical protein
MTTETFQDKLQRYAGRGLSSLSGPMKTGVCYMHLPKCGGNSIIYGMLRACPLYHRASWITVPETRAAAAERHGGTPADHHEDGQSPEQLFALRRELLNDQLAASHAVIAGHYLFDRTAYEKYKDQHKWVTVMRNPVDRVISHYREEHHSGFLDLSFSEYLDSRMGWNHATTYTRYFSGTAYIPPEELDEKLEIARQNMNAFLYIGFLEELFDFQAFFEKLTGKPLQITHRRAANFPKPDITPEDYQKLERLCAADRAIYDAARAR